MKQSKAYQQGLKDYKAGKTLLDNPYNYGSRASRDWNNAVVDCMNARLDEIIAKHNQEDRKAIYGNTPFAK